jgi:ribosomal protein L6P/L9E
MGDAMNDVTKLPKWAQEHIKKLECRVSEIDARIAAENGPDTRVQQLFGAREHKNLGDRVTVRFNIKGHEHIDVSMRDDHIYVSGISTIIITPTASNCIQVRVMP